MSTPRVPGFTSAAPTSLAVEWLKPEGDFPGVLWPSEVLARVQQAPAGWVVVKEHFHRKDLHGGTGAILANTKGVQAALKETTWAGRDLGDAGVVTSFQDQRRYLASGLVAVEGDGRYEFFVDVKTHSGFTTPSAEIAYPFLWYWGAYRTPAGWSYLNSAGRDIELVRATVNMDSWRIEVSALELRTFLADAELDLLVQLDYVPKIEARGFNRADAEWQNKWAHFEWHATPDGRAMPAFSRLLGQYVIRGHRTSRVPSWDEDDAGGPLPDFIYAIDPSTGALLKHTCDEDALGTYFDEDETRLHYLTPINFRREVLGRYAAEPKRYSVTSHRISCLNLWSLEIATNTAGLIEVFLGDLGKLPRSELAHWVQHNVPPEGDMEEGRFRRDFLGQFADSPDPVGQLQRARDAVREATRVAYGSPLFRNIDPQAMQEFQALVGPTTDDPSSLGGPVLVLVKALVDDLNSDLLRSQLGDAARGEQSLSLLGRWVERLGLDRSTSEPFAALQGLRSAGGIAHLAGSKAAAARARLGIDDMAPLPAFHHIAGRLTAALIEIAEAIPTSEVTSGDTESRPK